MSVRLIHYRPPRIAMCLVLFATAAWIMLPVSMHPALPAAGAATAAGGLGLMLRAWWLFRQAGTAICPTARSSSLIMADVFALTRNPMYLGIVLMLCGSGLATGELAFYLAAVVFFLIMDRVFCPFEEGKSLREFGGEYVTYRRQVRRWL